MRRNIALIGMMGSGKTTVGRALAGRLACPFLDLDEVMEQAVGMPISQIFQVHGEAWFRALEAETFSQLTEAWQGKTVVLATGGGIVTDSDSAVRLREHWHSVWLQASVATLAARLAEEAGSRPKLADSAGSLTSRVQELLVARQPLYAACSHVSHSVDGKDVEDVVDDIVRDLP